MQLVVKRLLVLLVYATYLKASVLVLLVHATCCEAFARPPCICNLS